MITYINEKQLSSITKENFTVSFEYNDNEDYVFLEYLGYDFSIGFLNPIKTRKFSSMIIDTGTKEVFDVTYNEDKLAKLESDKNTILLNYKNNYLDTIIKNDIEYRIIRKYNMIEDILAYQNNILINSKEVIYSNNLIIGFIESNTTKLFTFDDISITKINTFSSEYVYNY